MWRTRFWGVWGSWPSSDGDGTAPCHRTLVSMWRMASGLSESSLPPFFFLGDVGRAGDVSQEHLEGRSWVGPWRSLPLTPPSTNREVMVGAGLAQDFEATLLDPGLCSQPRSRTAVPLKLSP